MDGVTRYFRNFYDYSELLEFVFFSRFSKESKTNKHEQTNKKFQEATRETARRFSLFASLTRWSVCSVYL